MVDALPTTGQKGKYSIHLLGLTEQLDYLWLLADQFYVIFLHVKLAQIWGMALSIE